MNRLNVGDKVVHLSHGPGWIKGIEKRSFAGGIEQEFYILTIMDNGCPKMVFVPIENADKRLRPVMDCGQIDQVFSTLSFEVSEPIDHQTWNRRYREYMERVHSGDPIEIASVLRSLWSLKMDKDLSFGERKLMDQCFSLLTTELSYAMRTSEDKVEQK